jgi:hypothetical protein
MSRTVYDRSTNRRLAPSEEKGVVMDEESYRASEEIRNLLSEYHFFGDQGMATEYSELFAPEGVLETSGSGNFEGRAVIAEYLAGRHQARTALDGRLNQSRHHLASVYVYDVHDDEARAHSYFQVLTPYGRDHWGSYRDQLVRIEGRWRFARRVVTIDGQSEESWRSRVPQSATGDDEANT